MAVSRFITFERFADTPIAINVTHIQEMEASGEASVDSDGNDVEAPRTSLFVYYGHGGDDAWITVEAPLSEVVRAVDKRLSECAASAAKPQPSQSPLPPTSPAPASKETAAQSTPSAQATGHFLKVKLSGGREFYLSASEIVAIAVVPFGDYTELRELVDDDGQPKQGPFSYVYSPRYVEYGYPYAMHGKMTDLVAQVDACFEAAGDDEEEPAPSTSPAPAS